jgi:hypothetical protein
MTFERDTIRIFYKKLLALYPRVFREQFEESMQQTFDDVCRERIRRTKRLSFGFALWLFAETLAGAARENLAEIKRGKTMKNVISNNKSSALIGFLLAMPLASLLLIQIYDIEPLSGFYKTLTTKGDGYTISVLGRIFEIGALLLLLVGFIIGFIPIARNIRAGNGAAANPLNLLIAAVLFIFIAGLVIINVVDQYPCWIGVPNCD